jgi:uncharacterized protein (TIGR02147 family)
VKSVFEYIDYRAFLRDTYQEGKQGTPPLSYRSFARSLGFTSPNFLKLVIDGQRNVGKESLGKIAAGLKLGKRESEYLECLAGFNQARRPREKQAFFQRLSAFRAISGIAKLQADQFTFYNEWYHPVIRELINGEARPLDYAKLGARVTPPLTSRQVHHSVALLEKLGLIHAGADGRYRQTDRFLATDPEVQSLAIREFHRRMLGLAEAAMDGLPLDRREISSLTLKISEPAFQDMRRMIRDFKDQLLERARRDTEAERVYQVNFQLFPLSKRDA